MLYYAMLCYAMQMITSFVSTLTSLQARDSIRTEIFPSYPNIWRSLIAMSASMQRANVQSTSHRASRCFFMLKTPRSQVCMVPVSYVTVWPPQLGMVNPGFKFRPGSIKPHLSSHSLPGVLRLCFHGSSKASNLERSKAIS